MFEYEYLGYQPLSAESEPLDGGDPGFVWVVTAKGAGAAGKPVLLKVFQTGGYVSDDPEYEHLKKTRRSVLELHMAMSAASDAFALVHAIGDVQPLDRYALPDGLFMVTEYLPRSAADVLDEGPANEKHLGAIVGGVSKALLAIASTAPRGHGRLTPSNVRLREGAAKSIEGVALTDLEPGAKDYSRTEDLHKLGELIVRLVLGRKRGPRPDAPRQASDAWKALREGEWWRTTALRLYDAADDSALSVLEEIGKKLKVAGAPAGTPMATPAPAPSKTAATPTPPAATSVSQKADKGSSAASAPIGVGGAPGLPSTLGAIRLRDADRLVVKATEQQAVDDVIRAVALAEGRIKLMLERAREVLGDDDSVLLRTPDVAASIFAGESAKLKSAGDVARAALRAHEAAADLLSRALDATRDSLDGRTFRERFNIEAFRKSEWHQARARPTFSVGVDDLRSWGTELARYRRDQAAKDKLSDRMGLAALSEADRLEFAPAERGALQASAKRVETAAQRILTRRTEIARATGIADDPLLNGLERAIEAAIALDRPFRTAPEVVLSALTSHERAAESVEKIARWLNERSADGRTNAEAHDFSKLSASPWMQRFRGPAAKFNLAVLDEWISNARQFPAVRAPEQAPESQSNAAAAPKTSEPARKQQVTKSEVPAEATRADAEVPESEPADRSSTEPESAATSIPVPTPQAERKKNTAVIAGAIGGMVLAGVVAAVVFWPKNKPPGDGTVVVKPDPQPKPDPVRTPTLPSETTPTPVPSPTAVPAPTPVKPPEPAPAPIQVANIDEAINLLEIDRMSDPDIQAAMGLAENSLREAFAAGTLKLEDAAARAKAVRDRAPGMGSIAPRPVASAYLKDLPANVAWAEPIRTRMSVAQAARAEALKSAVLALAEGRTDVDLKKEYDGLAKSLAALSSLATGAQDVHQFMASGGELSEPMGQGKKTLREALSKVLEDCTAAGVDAASLQLEPLILVLQDRLADLLKATVPSEHAESVWRSAVATALPKTAADSARWPTVVSSLRKLRPAVRPERKAKVFDDVASTLERLPVTDEKVAGDLYAELMEWEPPDEATPKHPLVRANIMLQAVVSNGGVLPELVQQRNPEAQVERLLKLTELAAQNAAARDFSRQLKTASQREVIAQWPNGWKQIGGTVAAPLLQFGDTPLRMRFLSVREGDQVIFVAVDELPVGALVEAVNASERIREQLPGRSFEWPRNAPRAWSYLDGRASLFSFVDGQEARAWLNGASAAAEQTPYGESPPPPPNERTPAQVYNANVANAVLAHYNMQAPTIAQLKLALANANGGGASNLLGQEWAKLPTSSFNRRGVYGLPSNNRLNADDGALWFREVDVTSERFQNIIGNLAEFTADGSAFGGSALADAEAKIDVARDLARNNNVNIDLGLRLCFAGKPEPKAPMDKIAALMKTAKPLPLK